MRAYYSEIDPHAAAWLRELMADGHITEGEVDGRDIRGLDAGDLVRHERVHLFAGIGGWEEALRLAGWPAGRPVWTGSCPCQPYSSAGKGEGDRDHRNLWPEMFRLVRECRPPVVFGEQVASSEVVGTQLEASFVDAVQRGDYARANKLAKRLARSNSLHYHPRWLTRIRADLAGEGYALRWKVLGAHSARAPHIRQRLYWVAVAQGSGGLSGGRHGDLVAEGGGPATDPPHRPGRGSGREGERSDIRHDPRDGRDSSPGGLAHAGHGIDPQRSRQEGREDGERAPVGHGPGANGTTGGLGHADGAGRPARGAVAFAGAARPGQPDESGAPGGVGDASHDGPQGIIGPRPAPGAIERAGGAGVGFWDAHDLVPCRDGKSRRTGPGLFPLAHGVQGRVGLLRGAGNAIVPQTAALFIRAFLEATREAC